MKIRYDFSKIYGEEILFIDMFGQMFNCSCQAMTSIEQYADKTYHLYIRAVAK